MNEEKDIKKRTVAVPVKEVNTAIKKGLKSNDKSFFHFFLN